MGFAHMRRGSVLLHRFHRSCDGTVVCAVSPRGRRHKRRRLRRGCGAHRPNAAGLCPLLLPLRLTGCFVVAAVVLPLKWCLYLRPSACAATPRVRWRVPSAGVFGGHLLAVCAVYSAHFFHHSRKRLNVALACASCFLLARSLGCSERARLLQR